MDNIMPMATTDRHNILTSSLFGEIYGLLKKKEVHALQSDCALVHWGWKEKNEVLSLIDVSGNSIEDFVDKEDFLQTTIMELDYVKPDFFLFKKNPYLRNERGTRTAGCPDLIVEVWSRDNTKLHRRQKMDLYSSSPITEHWYIKQDSNDVECYYGDRKIESQCLTNILATRDGLEFDLRYLSI